MTQRLELTVPELDCADEALGRVDDVVDVQTAIEAGLSQRNASMHLACLAECGLVRWGRRGKFMDYEIADKRVVKLLDEAEGLLLEVGPLIDMCRRYQGATVRRATRFGEGRPRWRR